ncbi:hypothetical protein BJV82DRAFT_662874 [Fennellomyces sp. T-0311]|nr:hypothetical protein BJV82DRAFT_662874 [Fennellomyces sp. T-0311]
MVGRTVQSECATNQTDCLTTLPYDVAYDILSRPDQPDCLTCTAVCHVWYNAVPKYTKNVWKPLEVPQSRRYLDNRRYVHSLGSHVKLITVSAFGNEQQDLYDSLQKLVTYNCNALDSLEFVNCKTGDQDGFLYILHQHAIHITEIHFVDHGSNFSLLHVLAVCPQLTRFTFEPTVEAWKDSGIYDTEPRAKSPLLADLTFDI